MVLSEFSTCPLPGLDAEILEKNSKSSTYAQFVGISDASSRSIGLLSKMKDHFTTPTFTSLSKFREDHAAPFLDHAIKLWH
jgi:hypothetical protein